MKSFRSNQSQKPGLANALHKYADYRTTATDIEKKAYKKSDSILLTFDDYGSELEVKDILKILKNKSVKAVFFIQGDWAEENPELVSLIEEGGHVLGNHTYSHKALRILKTAEVKDQIARGLPGPWFRPPKGRYNKRIRRIASNLGYVICYWSIDSRDWTGISAKAMKPAIMSHLHPGAVILLHMHGKHTRELLPELIDDIRSRGYKLTDFSESWKP